MRKIVLNENFDLVETYNMLLESRGVIDRIEGLAQCVKNYIDHVMLTSEEKQHYFDSYLEKEKVTKYVFCVPDDWLNSIDTLFMYYPIITVNIFEQDSRYGDEERELGPNCYYSFYRPAIANVEGEYKLLQPRFEISFVVKPNCVPSYNDVASRLSHEIVHAKKNFNEYISMSKKRSGAFNRDFVSVGVLNSEESDVIEKLVGRILYLCSKDEINARANQLYYELKKFKILTRVNINKAVSKTNVYRFVEEMEEKKSELFAIEERGIEKEKISELLKNVYEKEEFNDPYKFLYNLLINRKNYFIRQIDKVKERILYENTLRPLKI